MPSSFTSAATRRDTKPLLAGLLAVGTAVKVPVPLLLFSRMEMMWPTGSTLNPAVLPTARSGAPSLLKSPATMACGETKPLIVASVGNEPPPLPNRTVTLLPN